MSASAAPEVRLAELGLELPEPMPAFGQFVPAKVIDDDLWVGGHFGLAPDGNIATGKVGADVDTEAARAVARSAALSLLATVRSTVGSLDRVRDIVRVYGVVNCTPQFSEQTAVLDAASDVLFDVFGEAGRHTRLGVGVAALPGQLVLEIEATIRLHPAH